MNAITKYVLCVFFGVAIGTGGASIYVIAGLADARGTMDGLRRDIGGIGDLAHRSNNGAIGIVEQSRTLNIGLADAQTRGRSMEQRTIGATESIQGIGNRVTTATERHSAIDGTYNRLRGVIAEIRRVVNTVE